VRREHNTVTSPPFFSPRPLKVGWLLTCVLDGWVVTQVTKVSVQMVDRIGKVVVSEDEQAIDLECIASSPNLARELQVGERESTRLWCG
jgi:hypothetical protein